MARRRKLNALSSLFGGIAQGFQLGQQLKDQKRRGKLQERRLSIKEEELDLKTQKALEAEKFRNSFMEMLSQQGGSSQLPSLNAPAALFGPPQETPPVQGTLPTPVAPTAPAIQESTTLPLSGTQAPLSLDPSVTQPLVPTGPVDQLSETFVQPSTPVQPAPVTPLPQRVNDQERLASITNFIQQLEQSLAEPGTPTTVTLSIPGGGSISKTLDKRATPDQHFSHFIEQMKRHYPTATPADLSGFLQNSTLRDTDAAQKFFNRSFNSAVNREFQFLKSQETGTLSAGKNNELRSEAIAETVKNFNGFVSKRHEKQFQPEKDIDEFELSEAVQAELNLVFPDPKTFARAMRDDPRGTANLLEKAISKVQARKVETAAAQGVGVIKAKIEAGLKLPVDPTDLVKMINPRTFAPFTAGTTWEEIKRAKGVAVTGGQRVALANINSSLDNVRIITELGKKLFVDQDLVDRIASAFGGSIQRFVQSNPDAIVYEDTVTAVTRTIARAFGEARITDFDAEDFRKSFPKLLPGRGETFFVPDSQALAQKKLSQLATIIDNSRRRIIGLPPITNTALTAEEKVELERLEKELGQ